MTTYTSQPDATDGIDTFMNNIDSDTNYATSTIVVGAAPAGYTGRGLIKFDFTKGTNPIPAYSQILSATLYITPSVDSSGNTRVMSVYRVLRAWTEAGATWNKYDGVNAWGTAGCANTTTDRESTAIGTATILANQTIGVAVPITLTASKVQEWLNGGLTNNGMLLQVATESSDQFRYQSSDTGSETTRPKIIINFIPHTFPKVIEF